MVMNRYAIVEDGIVVNVAVADAAFAAKQGWIDAPDGVGTGWTYDGKGFAAPPPTAEPPQETPEPNEIRRRLLKLAGVKGDVDDAKMAEVFMAADKR